MCEGGPAWDLILYCRWFAPGPIAITVRGSVERTLTGQSKVEGKPTMRRTVFLIILGGMVLASCDGFTTSLQGNGDQVTETRTVSNFEAVSGDDGVRIVLDVDSTVTGDVDLEVTTDSNLQEYLTTKVSGNRLSVSPDRAGGVTSTEGLNVSATVAAVTDVSVDNGAQAEIRGPVGDITLSADNGARIAAEAAEAGSVDINADNGADITVCATGEVTGEVTNGAQLTVLCGGVVSVETSDGGRVTSAP